MRARALYNNIPETLTEQLCFLVEDHSHPYSRAIKYLKTKDFARARGFSDGLTDQQLIREMNAVIRKGAG